MRRLPLLALCCAITLLTVTEAAAQQTRSRHVERTFAVDGRTVSLVGSAMDVVVQGGDGPEARLDVVLEYWSNSEEWMAAVEREFDVEVLETGQRVSVRPSSMPEERPGWFSRLFGRKEVSWSLRVTLEVPRGTAVEVENRYGDVQVRDAGAVTIDNSSGEVTVAGVASARIANRYAPISVSAVRGDLQVRGGSAEVVVRDVDGNADVTSTYASVTVRNVGGDLEASAQSGTLEVDTVGGRASLEGSYASATILRVTGDLRVRYSSGELRVEDVGGIADLETSYGQLRAEGLHQGGTLAASSGAVTVRDAGGNLTVRNSYAPVLIHDVRGDVIVDSSSASVTLEQIGGAVDAETSYDGVVVRGAGGAVRVRNQSGRIAVEGLSGAALTASHELTTSYANIDLSWPRGTTLGVEAECTYGSIRSDFPGSTERRNSGERLSIVAGAGATARISTRSGSINLRAQ